MKKIFLLSLCCLLLSCMLFACRKKTEETPTADIAYDMTLELNDNTLSGKQTVTFTNVYQDGLENAVFHLYANAYAEDATAKAYNGILPAYGGIEVTSATVNGNAVQIAVDESKQYLSVPLSDSSLGSRQTIELTYDVTVPQSRLRFGRYNDNYLLSSFYPQLAVYKEGTFLTDPFSTIGDPLYSPAAAYSVRFTCPSSLVVASGVKLDRKTDEGTSSTYFYSSDNVRDFALAASPDFNVLTDKGGDTELYYFFIDETDSQERFSIVKSAFAAYTDAFGPSGLDVYSVVVAPFDYPGMEFSGIVYVSDTAGEETAEALLHETAHQWWYNLVGSDPIRNSALDEGLTSFTTLYYDLLTGNEEKFNASVADVKKVYTQYETLQKRRKTGINLRLDGTIYDYTAYQYTMLMYYKACMLFNNLYELYGKEKFNACLRAYAEEYAHKEATFDDFVSVCNKVLKTDVGGLVNGWIGDNATVTTFSQK